MKQLGTLVLLVLGLVLAAGLIACGGGSSGGGSPAVPAVTISGVAAAGAPVVGRVTVKDANGTIATSTIDTNGAYSIDASSLTPPFLLFAEGTVGGKSVKIYSAGVATGTINITPVTDFIVRQAVGGDADTAYAAYDGTQVDATTLAAAETAVQAQIQPVLDASGIASSVDLISSTFTADGTGLDQVLDILDISYDATGESVTVTNKLTTSTFTDDVTTATDDAVAVLPPSDTTGTTTVLTELEQIDLIMSSLEALYATTAPTCAAIQSWGTTYMALDYLDEGINRTEALDEMCLGDEGPDLGMTLSFTIVNAITPPASVLATYTKAYLVRGNFSSPTESGSFLDQVVYDGTKWLWYGNQRLVQMDMEPNAERWIAWDGTVSLSTGLHLWIKDENLLAFYNGVQSVLVTGPGLPAAGAILNSNYPDPQYSPFPDGNWWYDMTDLVIAGIPDNATYTIKLCTETAAALYSSSLCTPVASYEEIIPKPPVLNSALTASMFPAITNLTGHTMADANIGGTLLVEWTNPADATVQWGVDLWWWDGVNNYQVRTEISGIQTSATLDSSTFPAATVGSAGLRVSARDVYERQFSTSWGFYTPLGFYTP